LYAERLRAQGNCRQAARGAEAVVTDGTGKADSAAHAWRPPRFMVIAAHPDDAEFGPAGTAAKWIDEGSVGWLVCCTSGDQGGEDYDADPLELAVLREEEQRAAAAIIGYEGVSFLNQPDGALVNDLALRELLVREIRAFRPDAILATDPEALFYADRGVNHTDHRAAGLAAVDAAYPAARNPMAFPWLARDGLGPHRVRRLYLFWSNAASVRIDVSATIGRKLDALRAHASQLKDPAALEERIRHWAAEEGQAIGVAAAEALRVIVIDDDADEGPEASEGEPAETTAATASAMEPLSEPAPEPAR
jgi:LmbE family N-acetylglucosaminyl deacetylase